MGRLQIVALLESMWGWEATTIPVTNPHAFSEINPDNFSGRRLYRLCGDAHLVVTNSCRVVQQSANHHGVPDPEWVKENLSRAQADGCDLFLICGAIAKATYAQTGLKFENVIFMDHPAARRWTTETLDEIAARIAAIRMCADSMIERGEIK